MENSHAESVAHLRHGSDRNCRRNFYLPTSCASHDYGDPGGARTGVSWFGYRDMVEAALLMSYGTQVADMFRQVGIYTGMILKGAKPTELPVLQSTKFEFVSNLQTARALGIEVPSSLQLLADQLIE